MATYLVTGTSRGLGLEIVRYLITLSSVSKVIATARSDQPSAALQEVIAGSRDKVAFVSLDTTSDSSIEEAVEKVGQLCGNGGLDVLINNAGIISDMLPIQDESSAALVAMFVTNVAGTHAVTKAFLPLLRKGGTRKIVNVSSEMGSVARYDYYTYFPTPAYKISKTALNGLSHMYSIDLKGENFIVVPINPGWLSTDMGGPKAELTPEQGAKGVVNVIQNLKSDDNGKFLNYNGEQLKW